MPVAFLMSHLVGDTATVSTYLLYSVSFLNSLEMNADSVNIIMMNAFKKGKKFKF